MRLAALRGTLIWLGLLLLAALGCDDPTSDGDLRTLTQSRFLLSDVATPPSDANEGWQSVPIPDRWSKSRPGVRGRGWYRFEFDVSDSQRDISVYVPHFNMNLEIWLNGAFLSECGPFDGANILCWNFPLQALLPEGELREVGNVLDLRLSVSDPEGELGVVYVGPRQLVAHLYTSRFLFHIILPQMFIAMTLVVIVFMLAFWYSSRDVTYLAFAGFAGCLGITMVNMVLREMPISLQSWRWVVDRGIGFIGPLLIVCTHRFVGMIRPRLERAVFGWTIAVAVATLLMSESLYDATLIQQHVVTLLMSTYAVWVLVYGLRASRRMQYSAGVVSLAALGFGVHDVLSMMGLLGPDDFRLVPFVLPASTLVMTAALTQRFLATFRSARSLNVELEERVHRKHAELEVNFERMRELEQAELEFNFDRMRYLEESRVVAGERERIMREMHDGVGGDLVSILAMVENGRAGPAEIAASVRSSIDDMRMLIDALDPNVDDLNVLLGVFRSHNEVRLRDQGLRLRWEVADLPAVSRLGRNDYLHIMRIVQEAVTNVTRHADAETIQVRAGVRDDVEGRAGAFIEVTDDGIGIEPDVAAGRGSVNMAERARMIGAELLIESTSEGTRVDLWIPQLRSNGS
jgi:signal transduction histidine kinase